MYRLFFIMKYHNDFWMALDLAYFLNIAKYE